MRRDVRSGRYQFVFARNGVEALERLNEDGDIDMVLSDINMPQMDGLTLLSQIPDVDPNIRSVIVSAYGDMKNIRTAMNRGAFDFVTKPLDFDDLRVTIDRTLRHLMEWREALSSRDQLVRAAERARRCEQDAAVDSPDPVSRGPRLPVIREHGACAQRWGRLLRRSAAGRRPDRSRHRRCLGQGCSGGPVHDVEPHTAEGSGYRQRSSRPRCSRRSTPFCTMTTTPRCS